MYCFLLKVGNGNLIYLCVFFFFERPKIFYILDRNRTRSTTRIQSRYYLLKHENISNKTSTQQRKLQNPTIHPTLGKGQRHRWGPLVKRNNKILFPPPQPRPGEKDCIIHQLRDDKRLIFKNHVISEVPNRCCSCYPPNLPLSVRIPRTSQGKVLKEVIPRPTMHNCVFLDPRVKLLPHWHNFFVSEKEMRGRFNLALAEGAKIIFNDNLPSN